MVRRVVLSRAAQRALRRVPKYIADKLLAWVELVEPTGSRRHGRFRDTTTSRSAGSDRGSGRFASRRRTGAIYTLRATAAGSVAVIEEVSKHGY
jgi:hypothetical protein